MIKTISVVRRTRRLCLAGAVAAASMVYAVYAAPAASAAVPRLGMICTNGPTFNLTAKSGDIETPDGNSVVMWSYANAGTGGHFQSPGPVLCVNQGDTVTVNLHNSLRDGVRGRGRFAHPRGPGRRRRDVHLHRRAAGHVRVRDRV
jgi:hypothetical protein